MSRKMPPPTLILGKPDGCKRALIPLVLGLSSVIADAYVADDEEIGVSSMPPGGVGCPLGDSAACILL